MGKLKYAVHAYAWTSSWSNKSLDLIDRAKRLGFDYIEIPLMELDKIDTDKISERLAQVGIGVCVSTACSMRNDVTSDDESTRNDGIEYLKDCVMAARDMGATMLSGVIYSAIGRKFDTMPDNVYWERSAKALKDVARFAINRGMIIGIEPVNRYESFLVNTCDQARMLLAMINEPNVKIHLDAYHMNIEEEDFYAATREAMPNLCHFHLSESHRGIPGTGTVDWDGIFRALAEADYSGIVGMESFVQSSDAMREATCIWRPMAPSSDFLLSKGLKFLKAMEKRHYG